MGSLNMRNSFVERLQTLIQNSKFKPRTITELKEFLEIRNVKKERELIDALHYLCSEGMLIEHKKKYVVPDEFGFIKGEVVRSSNGYVFVKEIKTEKEYFVPPSHTKNAIVEDIVLIQVIEEPGQDSNKNAVAHVKAILKREKEFLVGTYVVEAGIAYVEVDTKHTKLKLKVLASEKAVEGHEVLLKTDEEGKWIVHDVLGHRDEPTTEILTLLYNFGIKSEFDQETLDEADNIPNEIPEHEYYMRRDLREDVIVTIDGADAKDLDDAVQLRINEQGNYLLGVHIADVSYYVEKDSYLDIEALERGTSVYLTNKVVPMLPQRLSNGICSLLPNVERLTLSCEMEIDNEGNVVSYEIFDSVIKTTARLTYDEVNLMIKGDQDTINKYGDIKDMLFQMSQLSKLIRQKRFQKGSVDFDAKEPKIIVDKDNVPVEIRIRERGDAEKLIEEFMLIANETVAKHFSEAKLPFVYRIHDLPSEAKVALVSGLVARLGYPELIVRNIEDPKEIQKMIEGVKGSTIDKTIQTLAIRMMSKAVYSEENIGHYGLAKEFYTHFTSPIRRYPDLIVHRLIREFFLEHNITKKTRDYWTRTLPKITEHTSRKEQKAAEAERELLEIKKAEYMKPFEGCEFEGVISNVTEYGFYVELENTVQGLVSVESLEDFTRFEEEGYMILGTKNTFTIGDKVLVELVRADKYSKKIDFKFLKKTGN
ncbi:ribonuclease R [Bacillus cereus]|nr:ribonuclease R [Bacillus cereus]